MAERAFVRALGGGCFSPAAAYAVCEGEELVLTGLYAGENRGSCAERGGKAGTLAVWYQGKDPGYILDTIRGKRIDGERLGAELAERMRREISDK